MCVCYLQYSGLHLKNAKFIRWLAQGKKLVFYGQKWGVHRNRVKILEQNQPFQGQESSSEPIFWQIHYKEKWLFWIWISCSEMFTSFLMFEVEFSGLAVRTSKKNIAARTLLAAPARTSTWQSFSYIQIRYIEELAHSGHGPKYWTLKPFVALSRRLVFLQNAVAILGNNEKTAAWVFPSFDMCRTCKKKKSLFF